MDIDMVVIILSLIISARLWLAWYSRFFNYPGKKTPEYAKYFYALMFIPVLCVSLTWAVLNIYAASDVRDNLFYLFEYTVMGLAWLGIVELGFGLMGVSVVQDFLDRKNTAAFSALAGAFFGTCFCYIGSNIGEGPGFQVVIFCAGLSTLVFYITWWLYALVTQIDYNVAVGRDPASGLRLGGFLAATGLILGRAAAGNWVSYGATVVDMLIYGVPAALSLLLIAIAVERMSHPTVEHPKPELLSFGFAPLAVYILLASAYIVLWKFPA